MKENADEHLTQSPGLSVSLKLCPVGKPCHKKEKQVEFVHPELVSIFFRSLCYPQVKSSDAESSQCRMELLVSSLLLSSRAQHFKYLLSKTGKRWKEAGIVHPPSYNSPPYPANSKLRKYLSPKLLSCFCPLNGNCAPKLIELQTAELY